MGPVADAGPAGRQGFRKIVGYLRDYFRNDVHWGYLAVLLLFIGFFTALNFGFFPDAWKGGQAAPGHSPVNPFSEDVWIKDDPSPLSRLLKYALGYTVIFGGAWLLLLPFYPKDRALRSGRLWTLIITAALLFAVRAWYHEHRELVYRFVNFPYQQTAYKVVVNMTGFVFLVIPCTVYWFFADRDKQPLYGLKAKGVTLWPYFVLLAGMVPLLLAAATQPDFQQTYPRFKYLYLPSGAPLRGLAIGVYELAYSLDFAVTEFFFRGFLILALGRLAGPKVILPMCAFYVAIHFDKPAGEAISSFFGGLILGVLAYRSGSIYGGIIVHLGIALLMELTGWLT